MKIKMFMILFVTFFCWNIFAFCDSQNDSDVFAKQIKLLQSEIDSGCGNEKGQIHHAVLKANIHYIECSILRKLKHAEEKLEKYKNNLSNSENGPQVQQWFKKMSLTEKKIKNLNEILLAIEMLKTKIVD